MEKKHIKIISENRKARFNYFLIDEYEAGMVLKGTEVKALRLGRANLKDSYAKIKNGEVFLCQLHIGEYPFAYYGNHKPLRERKLLLRKPEIKKLYGKINEKGFSLIPVRLYFLNGKVKIRIAVAKGKQKYDKRQSIKQKDLKRDQDRERDRDR